ncbi:hypothetical protein [Streptomyces sp. SCL15-4]|uniref:hypothetical protein n=1 Tax=Streptomyces sp. SCL15-4 TaxID=2967221 RepID=UPI0029673E94|nr:hypothetical protein [Streptomyces sp. SCL15-4]
MAFRRSISQDELRARLSPEQRAQHETTYQASRGGHFPTPPKPIPGTPKTEQNR